MGTSKRPDRDCHFFSFLMLSGDFGGSAGTPRNQGWPKNAPKNLIRHHLGVPGRERGGPKLFKGPHGQGHRKKVRFVIEF